ncbi:hypothetical protein [Nonomuraea turcica]|uniref:hypothetical protein n=1 Tax=Nonomuraea sp. G32 TaxID=3067274 RepID=UPI00273B5CE1|nr:hypothetical protein [Nonomuraea sp. G32]MDP4507849.1 hypothetical protein [Nonomuraea sp. G32]
MRRDGDDYGAAMAARVAGRARARGWRLVADSSWEGHTEVPLDVMRGHTVLFDELAVAHLLRSDAIVAGGHDHRSPPPSCTGRTLASQAPPPDAPRRPHHH